MPGTTWRSCCSPFIPSRATIAFVWRCILPAAALISLSFPNPKGPRRCARMRSHSVFSRLLYGTPAAAGDGAAGAPAGEEDEVAFLFLEEEPTGGPPNADVEAEAAAGTVGRDGLAFAAAAEAGAETPAEARTGGFAADGGALAVVAARGRSVVGDRFFAFENIPTLEGERIPAAKKISSSSADSGALITARTIATLQEAGTEPNPHCFNTKNPRNSGTSSHRHTRILPRGGRRSPQRHTKRKNQIHSQDIRTRSHYRAII